MRILSVFGTSVMGNRGTPIRVRNLMYQFSINKDIEFFSYSRDETLSFSPNHFVFRNNFVIDALQILKVVKQQRIDIVVGHTINTYKVLSVVKLFTKAKVILEMHGFIEEEAWQAGSIGRPKYFLNKLLHKLFYSLCDLITTCSETAMERIKPYNKNTFAIYGGVDTNLFHPIVKPEYPFLTIGYAGNSRVWQGLPFLVETFLSAKLDQQGFKLQLLLSEEFSLPQGFRSVKVIDGVPPEDVPHILAKCDMLVIPREQNEVNRLSFPSKLMEYMAMGIPVVASKTSDMYKIVTDEVTGLLFEPGDAEALVASFLRLKDIQLRKRIGASARALVTEKYTWEYQANIMFDLLKNI